MTTVMNVPDPENFEPAPAASPADEPPAPCITDSTNAAPAKKTRKRPTPAQLLAELDQKQAEIDEARAKARKSLNTRATHLKVQLGGLLFAIAAEAAKKGEKKPWNPARQVIALAAQFNVKTERVTADLDRWILDQTELAAVKARSAEKRQSKPKA